MIQVRRIMRRKYLSVCGVKWSEVSIEKVSRMGESGALACPLSERSNMCSGHTAIRGFGGVL